MIRVIRSDGTEIMLNPDLIQSLDNDRETLITLVNGETLRVKNPLIDIVTKIQAHQLGLDSERQAHEREEKDLSGGR